MLRGEICSNGYGCVAHLAHKARQNQKKAKVGVDAQLCQFEPGTALKRFFITQGFYLPVSFTSPQVYHEKSILEILLLSFPRGVFFLLTFWTPLDGTGFSPKLPVGRCWWLPGTHHDRVTTLGAAALRPVTRACWEAGNSLVWWYRWLRGVKLMWRDLLYTVICNHNIYLYYIIIINPKQTQRRPKTAQQPVNARYFGGSSFGGICALYMAMKYPGARFLLKWMQFWCQDEHRKLHLPQMEILRWMGWHPGGVSLLLGWQWTLHGWRGTAW